MIVNHQIKKIFISVPKTGSTSIMDAIDPTSLKALPDIYHKKVSDYSSEYRDYTFIGMVRNPVERLLSLFYDLKKDTSHKSWAPNAIYQAKNFDDFIFSIRPHIGEIIHLQPMHLFFESSVHKNIEIYFYENYNTSYTEIVGQFGCDTSVIYHHRNTKNMKRVNHIGEEVLGEIRTLYADDFKIFYQYLDFSKYRKKPWWHSFI